MRTIQDLLPSLVDATRAQKIKWNSETGGDIYHVKIADAKLTIWEWEKPEDDASGYSLSMHRGSRIIDSIVVSEFEPSFKELRELFLNARRSFFGTDDVIASIEKLLKEM